ncbi:hypothetical protein IW262DRAFT_219319 [Armillaria fumosa]|nr:hypothetical protein IW262DRAFT_219319 [Armillaria fumosa]
MCMTGTRVPAIDEIESWIEGCNRSIFWYCGMAGAGKSSLMATLHQRLAMQASEHPRIEEKKKDDKRMAVKGSSLAAFIRCDFNRPSNTDKLIPTMAHALCCLNMETRTAISRVLSMVTVMDTSPSSAKEQLTLLLQQLLMSMRGIEGERSWVIMTGGWNG